MNLQEIKNKCTTVWEHVPSQLIINDSFRVKDTMYNLVDNVLEVETAPVEYDRYDYTNSEDIICFFCIFDALKPTDKVTIIIDCYSNNPHKYEFLIQDIEVRAKVNFLNSAEIIE